MDLIRFSEDPPEDEGGDGGISDKGCFLRLSIKSSVIH